MAFLTFRRIGVILLLAMFVYLVRFLVQSWNTWLDELCMSVVLTLLFWAAPFFRKHVGRLAEGLRATSRGTNLRIAAGVFVVWTLADFVLLKLYGRPLMLLWQDEYQFFLQTQHLARFRVSMPPHPLVDFFDTFYVFVTPRYAAQSFPGAALLFVPTVWFHLPTWLMPLLVAGASAALVYWVLSQITNGLVASIATWVLLSLSGFRYLSTMYMAQIPVLFFGLLGIAFALEWRRSGSWRWALLLGAAMGWAAITRPLDAVAFAICVGLLSVPGVSRFGLRKVAVAVACACLAATPFLALQLWSDHVITGQWLKLPFTYYNERDQPALAFSVADGGLTRHPLTNVPQKQWFYDSFAKGYVETQDDPNILWVDKLWLRFVRADLMYLPSLAMGAFLFIGVLGLTTLDRIAIASLLPFYAIAYGLYPIYLFHYITFALPAVVLLYGVSPEVIGWCLPRARGMAESLATLFIVVSSGVGVLAQIPHTTGDPMSQEYDQVQAALAKGVKKPAIVLFRVDRQSDLHFEPVYNSDVAWPDDAAIIHAHDRGADNLKLYRYYAARQPWREVYLYDRPTKTLRDLGNVKALAEAPATAPATQAY